MIRPINLVLGLAMVLTGAWMFVVKHRTEALERQIGSVTAQVRMAEQKIEVLRAEWALENDPTRLAALAQHFMPTLKPMAPDQLVTWRQLADRLPAPGAGLPGLPLPPPLVQPPGGGFAQGGARDLLLASAQRPEFGLTAPDKPTFVRERAKDLMASAQRIVAEPVPVLKQGVAGVRAAQEAPLRIAPSKMPPLSYGVATRFQQPERMPARVVSLRQLPPPSHRATAPVQTPAQPMGARVLPIIAHGEKPLPLRSNRMVGREIQTAAHPLVSVFGGLGADLPPPRPIGRNETNSQ